MNLHPLLDTLGNWDDWFLPPILCCEWYRVQQVLSQNLNKTVDPNTVACATYLHARWRMSKTLLTCFNTNTTQLRTASDIAIYETAYAQIQLCAALVQQLEEKHIPCLYELAWTCSFTTSGIRHSNWAIELALLKYNIIALALQLFFVRLRIHQPAAMFEVGSSEQSRLLNTYRIRDIQSYVQTYHQESSKDANIAMLQNCGVLPDASVLDVVEHVLCAGVAHWMLLHIFMPVTVDKTVRQRILKLNSKFDDTDTQPLNSQTILQYVGIAEYGYLHADKATDLMSIQADQMLKLRKSEFMPMLKYAIQSAFLFNILRNVLLAKSCIAAEVLSGSMALGCVDALQSLLQCPTAKLLRNEWPEPQNAANLQTSCDASNIGGSVFPDNVMQCDWSIAIMKIHCIAEFSPLEVSTILNWANFEISEFATLRTTALVGTSPVTPIFKSPDLKIKPVQSIVEQLAQNKARQILQSIL